MYSVSAIGENDRWIAIAVCEMMQFGLYIGLGNPKLLHVATSYRITDYSNPTMLRFDEIFAFSWIFPFEKKSNSFQPK